MSQKRNFSIYEINRLIKHGINPNQIEASDNRPIEYMIGRAEFLDREFVVNQHTLIPRVETEEILPLLYKLLLEKQVKKGRISIADVGCGSGCLGISLYLELKNLGFEPKAFLSDISTEALEVTKVNIDRIVKADDKNNLILLKSDLLLSYPDHVFFDVIVANLPYIPREKISSLDKSVIDFEPHKALDGGGFKGLELVNQLVAQAEKLVFLPNLLILEIDEFVNIDDIYKSNKFEASIYKDSFEKNRFLVYTKKPTQKP